MGHGAAHPAFTTTVPARPGRRHAFTLIELVAVVVVLAVLAGVAIPKYFDYRTNARASACKAILTNVRQAINNYRLKKIANGETDGSTVFGGMNYTGPFGRLLNGYAPGQWPTVSELTTAGLVMTQELPANPFNGSAAVRDAGLVAVGTGAAYPVTGASGWAYSPDTGEFWANERYLGRWRECVVTSPPSCDAQP